MYYRQQGYRQSNMNVPPNYGGNAFFDKADKITEEQDASNEALTEESHITQESTPKEIPTQFTQEPAEEVGLFKKNSFLGGKIGSEELLLLAVIFLISDSEGSDDILWLLILLLFIK